MSAAALFLIGSLCLAVTAQAQTCSRPVGGPNMGLKGDDILSETFADGAQVSFACDVGYTRTGGSPVIICTAGSWSPVKLICERKNCGSVGEVANGVVDYPQGTEFGDKAVITCNPGYTLVGRKEITCLDQGWDSRLATCEEVTCDPPPAVTDATFSPDKETYGYREVVQYRCKSGYTLNGTEHLLCSDGGRFTPDPPACVKVQCYEPNIANAEWQSGSRPPYGHKSVVTYKCKTGYDMKGESTLTCGIDSQWSPKLPTCQKIELPKTTTTAATTPTTTTTTTTTTSVSPKKPTGTDDPETPKGKGNTPLVLGIVIPIVIVIVLGLVIFMVRKKRGKRHTPVRPTLLNVKPSPKEEDL